MRRVNVSELDRFESDLIEAAAAQHDCGCERCQAHQSMLKDAAVGRWLTLGPDTQAVWLDAHPDAGKLGGLLRRWLAGASEHDDLADLARRAHES